MTRNSPLHLAALVGLLTAIFSAGRLGQDEPAPQDPLELARDLSKAYHELAEGVGPAVVQVRTYSTSRRRRSLQDGSGVVVRADGVIVTNIRKQLEERAEERVREELKFQ